MESELAILSRFRYHRHNHHQVISWPDRGGRQELAIRAEAQEDQVLGRLIGSAKAMGGLYYLEGDPLNFWTNDSVLNVTWNAKVLLRHKHLGHPSFPYLKSLFPKIFINKEHSFSCESCTLTKQPRYHHPIQSYKPSKPFHLIHSDILFGVLLNTIILSDQGGSSHLSMITLEPVGFI
ncbi:uncharacterized protein LOC127788414 isoform X1 [Diospyros lotus]|uniref:uncharacterized protein LOC127788414 isoform X1 n=1 Tax=Diospyros lotus TaxID=55363 RepID=UPI002253FC86|nr:uncharacterized protein LOC127788414 isoform X1 [Diospyros lotus]